MTNSIVFKYILIPTVAISAYLLFTVFQGPSTPLSSSHPAQFSNSLTTEGFTNARFSQSVGGHAHCVEGTIDINVNATNRKINVAPPKDNLSLAQLIKDYFAPNSNFSLGIDGGENPISGAFGIYAKLCIPKATWNTDSPRNKVVHVLTHGGTLDSTYWDFASGYSYVDQAAEAGYPTFFYDRLGSGRSDHPDAIQVTQAAIQVEIAHILYQRIRRSGIANQTFTGIVAVGHSAGSSINQAVMKTYPEDVDVAILTGHSAYFNAAAVGYASTAQAIANTVSDRFKGLHNGYITPAPIPQALLFAFYHHPHFDPMIFEKNLQTLQTNALGETLTLISMYLPAPDFRGPVAIINGRQDFYFCGGDCLYSDDITANALTTFFPAAANTSMTRNFDNTGHNINFHYSASKVNEAILQFVDSVQLG